MTEPQPDRTGYTVTEQTPEGGGQTSWTIVRDLDGTGLGAYADPQQVDQTIERDRKMIATLPEGLDYVPPLVSNQPEEPAQEPKAEQ